MNVDLDPRAEAFRLLGFQGVPATVLIDHQGGYLASFPGAVPEEMLEASLQELGY